MPRAYPASSTPCHPQTSATRTSTGMEIYELYSQCQELRQQVSWLLIGYTVVNNQSEAMGKQFDLTVDMTTTHKFPLQVAHDVLVGQVLVRVHKAPLD